MVAAEEVERAEEAYRRFWAVSVSVGQGPQSQWRSTLAAVATDPLLSQLLNGLSSQRARGRVEFGVVTPHPTVVATTEETASIVDCQDTSRSGERDVETGLPRTVGSARTLVTAAVRRQQDRRWLVSAVRYVGDPC